MLKEGASVCSCSRWLERLRSVFKRNYLTRFCNQKKHFERSKLKYCTKRICVSQLLLHCKDNVIGRLRCFRVKQRSFLYWFFDVIAKLIEAGATACTIAAPKCFPLYTDLPEHKKIEQDWLPSFWEQRINLPCSPYCAMILRCRDPFETRTTSLSFFWCLTSWQKGASETWGEYGWFPGIKKGVQNHSSSVRQQISCLLTQLAKLLCLVKDQFWITNDLRACRSSQVFIISLNLNVGVQLWNVGLRITSAAQRRPRVSLLDLRVQARGIVVLLGLKHVWCAHKLIWWNWWQHARLSLVWSRNSLNSCAASKHIDVWVRHTNVCQEFHKLRSQTTISKDFDFDFERTRSKSYCKQGNDDRWTHLFMCINFVNFTTNHNFVCCGGLTCW